MQTKPKVTKHDLLASEKLIIKSLMSPLAVLDDESKQAPTAPAAANNLLGLCSIQDFSGVFGNHNSDLHATHADARGFYTYLNNWYTANYWYGDGAVKTWLYEEPYDHWQNIYGVDAVCIFYHSGHGNMTSGGVFQAPMGGKWNNESWFFSNNKAFFGNQRVRYVFWSTCLSCRVGGGLTPISTWWADDSNPGFRMLFGFETTSIDSGNYGSNFWNHWKSGEAFSTAWLNASWDIYHNQSPSVVASGANATEASSILYNERFFNWSAVARNWYQWRWYYASTVAARNKMVPDKLMVAELAHVTFEQDEVNMIAKTLGLQNPVAGLSKDGVFSVQSKDKMVSLNEQGHLNIKLANINYKNKKKLDEKEAIKIAETHIKKHDLDHGQKLKFDMIRLGVTAGGNTKDIHQKGDEYITDTTVQFKQEINGVPTINYDQGVVRVTIDNDGTVTHMHSSVKKVVRLSNFAKNMNLDPKNDGNPQAHLMTKQVIEKSFKEKISSYQSVKLVEDSEETGYDIAEMHGRLVEQRVYEVTYEQNFKKLIKVIVPLFE
jgi:hypothetical protein